MREQNMSSTLEITEDERYDVKTIEYSEDGPGAYTLMFTRAKLRDHEPLNKRGFKTSHDEIFVTLINSGLMDTSYEPHTFCREHFADDDHTILKFLMEFMEGDLEWDSIEDGATYHHYGLATLLEDGNN